MPALLLPFLEKSHVHSELLLAEPRPSVSTHKAIKVLPKNGVNSKKHELQPLRVQYRFSVL